MFSNIVISRESLGIPVNVGNRSRRKNVVGESDGVIEYVLEMGKGDPSKKQYCH